MNNNYLTCLRWLGFILLLGITIVIVALDLGGWGTFLTDIAISLIVQFVIALALFGIILIVLTPVKARYEFPTTQRQKLFVFIYEQFTALEKGLFRALLR